MASIFDPFSVLDPKRARDQIETSLDEPIFDNYSALDPARELKQIETAYGIEVSPLAAMDPARIQYEIDNSDTTPPAPPSLVNPGNGTVINPAHVTLSGGAEAGSTVKIYFNDVLADGTVVADEDGNFEIVVTGYPLGALAFTATATDAHGNTSEPSEARNYVSKLMLSRWTYDTADMSGSTANDVAGSSNGTLIGSPALVAGIVGDQAVSLVNTINTLNAAADQYMSAPYLGGITGPFSITFWAKNAFLPGPNAISSFVGVGKINVGFGLRVVYNKFTRQGWLIEVNTTPTLTYARFNSLAPNGSGTHFYAATWDPSVAVNGRFFRDAVEVPLTASQNTGIGVVPIFGSSDTIFVGASVTVLANGPYDGAKAIVDDPRIYNRVIPPDEITAIYNENNT